MQMENYQPLIKDEERIIRDSVKVISDETGMKRSKVITDLIIDGLFVAANTFPAVKKIVKSKKASSTGA